MSEDAITQGFVRMKALLIEAQETFGEEQGLRMVALAGVMVDKAKQEGTTTNREECYRFLVDLHQGDPASWEAVAAELG